MSTDVKNTAGPIFIVGMNGSGTTMLADCLNHHPMVYIHRVESRVIPYYYHSLENYGDLNKFRNFDRLLSEFSNSYAFQACNGRKPLKIQYDFSSLKRKDFATIVDLTFSFFSQKQNKVINDKYFFPSTTIIIPVFQYP